MAKPRRDPIREKRGQDDFHPLAYSINSANQVLLLARRGKAVRT